MKKYYILIFFLIGISSFALGGLVGYYETFPFDILKNPSQVDNSHTSILDEISDIIQSNIKVKL